MNRIEKKFAELKKKGKKAFIVFITAGYPSLDTTKKLVLEFARSGVDIVELGVPFSDPMADGPLIQEASQHALGRKVNLSGIFDLVSSIRKKSEIPLCLMTYYNPVFCFGEERFCRRASLSGVDGVIVPDLPPEEGRGFIRKALKNKLDVIHFIAPTTSRKRCRAIAGVARGFIYYVSLTGVTGPRKKLPDDLEDNIRRIKSLTRKPVCVGFGISNRAQAQKICSFADGIIVGSAVIQKIRENRNKKGLVKHVVRFVRGLKA